MASESTDLSTRMSAEDENIGNMYINNLALTFFKKYKVEISDAIKTTFPFLELIRDRGFITNEMYEKSQESSKRWCSVHEVIYDIISELEKKFDMSVLQALFSEVIMNKYPDLYRIYKIFSKEIPDIKSFLEMDGEENEERPNDQLSLEQGTALPEHELSENCCETQQTNVNEAGTATDNNNTLESQEENEQGGQASEQEGTMDFGDNSISGKAKKRKRTKMHVDKTVDFNDEILPVTCGKTMGMLIKRKLGRGVSVKCIRTEDGKWFTPREFEIEGGYEKTNNWRNNVCCGGKPLIWLIEEGGAPHSEVSTRQHIAVKRNDYLPHPPYSKKRKLENSKKCKICGDEGKLFKCSFCLIFFHENCHIPPVDPERKDWKCTFCTTDVSSRRQQHVSYSAVLARLMGPNEMSKCVFLLLKIYTHLESNIFQNIPHEHYVQKASQCLEKLRTLDKIKKSLITKTYPKMKGFVLAMNKTFQDPKDNDPVLTEEEFQKYFKDVFAIQ